VGKVSADTTVSPGHWFEVALSSAPGAMEVHETRANPAWVRRCMLKGIHTQLWDTLRLCRWAERCWSQLHDYQRGRYTVGEIIACVRNR
jgi:hypothetical protein